MQNNDEINAATASAMILTGLEDEANMGDLESQAILDMIAEGSPHYEVVR